MSTTLAALDAWIARRDRLLASRFFLVRIGGNAGLGEAWRCRNCGGRHRYLTSLCVERPFDGLAGGLFGYWRTVGATGAEAFLTPAQRTRLERIGAALGGADLARSHPETARALAVRPGDLDLGALALGVLEPIDARRAADLVRRINRRAGRDVLSLPGLVATR